MHSKKTKIVLAISIIAMVVACKSVLYMPTAENVSQNANIDRLKQGRELYINKCGSCHMLFAPEKFNKADWTKWVNRMAPKAKLTDEQKVLVQDYLTKGV